MTSYVTAVLCAHDPPPIWCEVAKRLCHFFFSEVVVVDDGSIAPLEFPVSPENRAPFKLIRSSENIGLAAARNGAIQRR